MAQKGFSLLEFLVYFLLLILFGTLLFHGAVSMHLQLTKAGRQGAAVLSLHAAADVLTRDLRTVPAEQTYWKKITDHELVWQTGNTTCGWRIEKNQLCRYEGTYDGKKRQWSKRTKSVVADGVHTLAFQMHGGEHQQSIASISFVIEGKNKSQVSSLVALRNRMVT